MNALRIYLHALSPIHSGIGRAADIVDLPIAREKATGWPVIPGSSVKGTLRDLAKGSADELFGNAERGGSIAVSDLRILCLPVRSFYGTFAWVTSPLVVSRFARDAKALGQSPFEKTLTCEDTGALIACDSEVAKDDKLYLEDLDLTAKEDDVVAALATAIETETGIAGIAIRLVVVSDTIFSFLCETATEVVARVKLQDEQKTVQKRGLWWEEAVPAEAIFYGFGLEVRGDDGAANRFMELIEENGTLFLGGNTTVGRGLCRMVVKA